ncbi:reverse transcriptase, RNA-dependent DNA polymerase [Tanacetum coccineum]
MAMKKLKWKSPYEVPHNKAPTYDHLMIIGCLCYATVTKPHKDKFDDRGVKCVLLGYKLYNLSTEEVFLSKDVIFYENVFPFKEVTPAHPIVTHGMPTFADFPFDDELSPLPNTPLPPESNTHNPTTHIPPASNTLEPTTHIPPDQNVPTQIPSAAKQFSQTNATAQNMKSTRQSARPSWLKYFVTPHAHGANVVSTTQYPLFGPSNFKRIHQSHIAFLANTFAASDPTSFNQASADVGWFEAMDKELAHLSLYGLKQASRQWNHALTKFLTIMRYVQSKHDYSLFVKKDQGIFTTALVYVDDVLITGNSESEILSLEKGTPLSDPGSYRRLLGRLLYLTMTRPNISSTVQHLSQFVSAPKDVHMHVVMHLLRYLKETMSKGLLYPVQPHLKITCFTDADWASCLMARRSLTRTKHLKIDCHFTRDKVQDDFLQIADIPSHLQLADIMTKALGNIQHLFLIDKLGISYVPT